MNSTPLLRLGSFTLWALLGAGCLYDHHRHRGSGQADFSPNPVNGPGLQAGVSAYIDSDAILDVTPGEGAGVMVEYRSGGHWSIRTVCDSVVSARSCQYEVYAQSSGGAVGSVRGVDLEAGDRALLYTGDTAMLLTSTGADVDEIRFDSAPGASMRVTSWLDGNQFSDDVFWIEAGLVPPAAARSNPVDLTPSSP